MIISIKNWPKNFTDTYSITIWLPWAGADEAGLLGTRTDGLLGTNPQANVPTASCCGPGHAGFSPK